MAGVVMLCESLLGMDSFETLKSLEHHGFSVTMLEASEHEEQCSCFGFAMIPKSYSGFALVRHLASKSVVTVEYTTTHLKVHAKDRVLANLDARNATTWFLCHVQRQQESFE